MLRKRRRSPALYDEGILPPAAVLKMSDPAEQEEYRSRYAEIKFQMVNKKKIWK